MLTLSEQSKAIIKAAVDERFGENTSQMVTDYQQGDISQETLAARYNLTQQAISQRVRKARTFTRRILRAAGVTEMSQAA
jgi:predicted DNA-binding protein YlxM (UPF0122 family)